MYARRDLSAEEANTSTLCAGGQWTPRIYPPCRAGGTRSAVDVFLRFVLGQSAPIQGPAFLQEKGRRQELYREFVDEASKLYRRPHQRSAGSVQDDRPLRATQPDAHPIVAEVVEEADKCATDRGLLSQANKTFSELRL